MTSVIIDTDPGTDDALALMMALNSPALEVLGVTTVGGNASLAHTTRNALRILEYMDRPDVPVYRGTSRPLKGRFEYAYYFHGPGGLTARLPLHRSRPRPERAAEIIAEAAASHAGKLVLVALGPLTNVAIAMAQEPRLADWVKEIVVMGGAINVPGNITPHAEFNVHNDPLAASRVLASGAPVTHVGLDVCDQTHVTRDDIYQLSTVTKSGRLARRMLANWFGRRDNDTRYALCDPLALLSVLEPDVMRYRQATVAVETGGGERLGKTSAKFGPGPVRVATGVDAPRAEQAIWALVQGQPS